MGAPVRPNGESVVLRSARLDEFSAASDLIRAAYREYAARMPDRWQRYLDRAADVWSRADEGELLVAERDGSIVGSVTFYHPGPQAAAQGWPEGWAGIRLLAVPPAERGRGFGRAIMEATVERARQIGAGALALHTTEMMAIARAMYERMGFERVPEYDFHPSSGRTVMAYRFLLKSNAAASG